MLTPSQVSPALPAGRCTWNQEGALPGQVIWATRGIFHPTECRAQYINQGESAERHRSLLWNGLGIVQQVLSSCTGHALFLLGFTPPSLSFHSYYSYHDILFCFSYQTVLISAHEFQYFFPWLSSPPWMQRSSGCVVLSARLGLNQDKESCNHICVSIHERKYYVEK